ncbi:MAG TPA: DUF4139 domain-containing protein [Myxococcota bacterium]|nr:DUF4139 domain-containing protein [Myxococcota bacterium]
MSVPIIEVTVLEDRAQVLRRGTVELPAGSSVIEVELAPVFANKSLSVRVDGAALAGTRIHREILTRAGDQDTAVLEERVALSAAELDADRRRIGELQAESELWGRAADLHAEELSEDTARGLSAGQSWSEGFARLDEEEARVVEARLRLQQELTLRRRAHGDLQRALQVAMSPGSRNRAVLQIELHSEGGPAVLEIEYLVPCACWRPWHQATLQGGQLRWQSDACIWQNTGEDWDDARIHVSTERPSLGVEPPKLGTDRVVAVKVGSRVDVETREQQIQTTGLGGGRTASQLPGVDDGGETLRLGGERASIPSDGRPHRVPLFDFESAATLQLLLKAERSPAVILRSQARHSGVHPILAGPVDLLRDSGFVGRSNTLFVAPGEDYELGWGPEPSLRVHRKEETEEIEARMLSSWSTTEHRLELKLSNIGARKQDVHVVERIPVSEVEKVKIELQGDTADKDGFVSWDLELPAYSTAAVDLCWRLQKHRDVEGI